MNIRNVLGVVATTLSLCVFADTPYTVTVPEGATNEFSEADLEALGSGTYDVLIKDGPGVLRGKRDIATFAGEIRITEGIWLVDVNGNGGFFGTSDATVRVTDGAAIHVKAPGSENQLKFVGGHFFFEGSGPDGQGVLVNVSPCDEYNLFLCSKITLTADTTFASKYRLDLRKDTAGAELDCQCFKLTYNCTDPNGYRSFYITGDTSKLTTSGELSFNHAMFGVDGGYLIGQEGSCLVLTNGSSFYRSIGLPLRMDAMPMGLRMYNGASINAEKSGASSPLTYSQYGTNYNNFTGPIELSGTVTVGGNGTGSPLTFGGPVSGSGTLDVPLARLQLTSGNNTYTGRITVRNAGANSADNVGLRLYRGANMPPAESLSIQNSELVLDENEVFQFPAISLTGLSKVIGGLATNANARSTAASLTYDVDAGVSENVLTWDAALDVTGETVIKGGTLRLAKPKLGTPGLFEARFIGTPTRETGKKYFYDYNGVDGWKSLDCTTRRREGPAACFSRADCQYYMCVYYHGYVWNRTDHDVTWDIAECMGTYVYFYIDRVGHDIGSGQGKNKSHALTLTPGAHELSLYIVDMKQRFDQDKAWAGPTLGTYTEWWPFTKYAGLAYDPNGTIGVDCTDASVLTKDYIRNHFIYMMDPGDGSLFTADDKTTDEIDQRGYHPGFSNLVVKAGAAIDLNGNDLAVGRLGVGTGVISNGTLTVKGGFNLSTANLGEGPTVKGAVTILDGATLEIDETVKAKSGTYVLLTAEGGITGRVTVDREAHPDWTVRVNGNTVEATRERGLMLLVR